MVSNIEKEREERMARNQAMHQRVRDKAQRLEDLAQATQTAEESFRNQRREQRLQPAIVAVRAPSTRTAAAATRKRISATLKSTQAEGDEDSGDDEAASSATSEEGSDGADDSRECDASSPAAVSRALEQQPDVEAADARQRGTALGGVKTGALAAGPASAVQRGAIRDGGGSAACLAGDSAAPAPGGGAAQQLQSADAQPNPPMSDTQPCGQGVCADDYELQLALALSLEQTGPRSASQPSAVADADALLDAGAGRAAPAGSPPVLPSTASPSVAAAALRGGEASSGVGARGVADQSAVIVLDDGSDDEAGGSPPPAAKRSAAPKRSTGNASTPTPRVSANPRATASASATPAAQPVDGFEFAHVVAEEKGKGGRKRRRAGLQLSEEQLVDVFDVIADGKASIGPEDLLRVVGEMQLDASTDDLAAAFEILDGRIHCERGRLNKGRFVEWVTYLLSC